MILEVLRRSIRSTLVGGVVLVLALTACAGRSERVASDSAEAVLLATEERTRTALVQVLIENGYEVTVDQDGARIRTGYREETDGPWDRLLVYRFGTIRSWVEATIAPDSEATRVKIDVFAEGKDSWLGSWKAFEAPLPQRAVTHLRQVRKALALL